MKFRILVCILVVVVALLLRWYAGVDLTERTGKNAMYLALTLIASGFSYIICVVYGWGDDQ